MTLAAPEVTRAYAALLEMAIVNLRSRLRNGEAVSTEELEDFLDALHNVPALIRNYGGWYVEENIDADLKRYDDRWLNQVESKSRRSLVQTIRQARQGEFDAE
jgi:hypothetical protein